MGIKYENSEVLIVFMTITQKLIDRIRWFWFQIKGIFLFFIDNSTKKILKSFIIQHLSFFRKFYEKLENLRTSNVQRRGVFGRYENFT